MNFQRAAIATRHSWAHQRPIWLILAGALVLAAAIGLHLFTINQSQRAIGQTHAHWQAIQDDADERLILLLQLRNSIGYGGIAEHFRDYVLTQDDWDAAQFRGAVGSALGWIAQLRKQGVNDHEQRQLAQIEKIIAAYQQVFDSLPAWRAEGLDPAAIFKRARIDDEVATRSFERLEIEWQQRKTNAEAALSAESRTPGLMTLLGWVSVPLVIAAAIIQLLSVFNLAQAQRSTRLSQTRLRAVLDNAPDGILTLDSMGVIRNFNRGAEQMYGWSAKEAIGKPFTILVHGGNAAQQLRWFAAWMNDDLRPVFRSDWRQLRGVRREGEVFPLMSTMSKILVDGELIVIAIVRDMGEVLNAESALIESREAALLASRAKSRFLANMSHELRTPLNAILGFSELMRDGILGPQGEKKFRDYAGLIHNAGAHLLSIVNDVLDYAKIESGKLAIMKEMLDAAVVAQNALDTVAPQTEAKRLTVALQAPEDLPRLFADSRAINQMLLNLLSNAIKFTPPEGAIGIDISPYRFLGVDYLRLQVTDNGRGIPPEHLERVLRPFEQADGRDAHKRDPQQGTGLGLSIVKSLAEAHGGRLEIESALGRGTTVAIHLPLAEQDQKAHPQVVPFTLKRKRA